MSKKANLATAKRRAAERKKAAMMRRVARFEPQLSDETFGALAQAYARAFKRAA